MWLLRGRGWPLVVLILGSSACQGAPAPHASNVPHPSASAAASSNAQRCQRLAQRGFTPCPPTPDKLQLPPTTIKNATNGAVSDAAAKQWGRAFQLTEAYYRWALKANARNALTAGVLSDATPQALGNLFGSDLQDLDAAKRAGGVLVYEPPLIPVVQVVAIPTDLSAAMTRQGLLPEPYGLAVRFTGPTRRSIRLSDGTETEVLSRDPSFSIAGLVWGRLKADPDLGSIWYESGSYGCDGNVETACQL